MPLFIEKPDKLNLPVSDSDDKIYIELNVYHKTRAVCMFGEPTKVLLKGQKRIVGKAKELKDKSVTFAGNCNNPSDGELRVEFIIYESNGNRLVYNFPKDYQGTPPFDKNNSPIHFRFTINFS